MEAAPLNLAHTHARNAVLETRKSNPVAASEEHDLAAGEFATAAQSSANQEALRTLHLLEQHHKQLAQILRFHHEHPQSATTPESPTDPTATGSEVKIPSSGQDIQQPPKLPGNARSTPRESSSIVSNLASARGIPSHPRRSSPASPALSSHQAGAKMTDSPTKLRTDMKHRAPQAYGSKDRSNRAPAPRQPWSPPTVSPTEITSQQMIPADSGGPQADEPFQRFYSTFEGLISKLSAPLAFAGLPLSSDATDSPNPKSSAETKLDRHNATPNRASTSTEPDVDRLYSRAALRAIRDNNRGGPNSTAESFYVVPTTGGTVSYAGILNRADREVRRTSFEEAEDDFVDARETPSSPELRHSMTGAKGNRYGRGSNKPDSLQNPKTLEELQMENQALKHLSDTLSKRLHMWEVNAQSSSMALQQSLKAMHQQSATTSPERAPQHAPPLPSNIGTLPNMPSGGDEQRIKELEDAIQRSEKELDKSGRENEKLRAVLGRYRERWEKLKEGAKTRRAEARSGSDNNDNSNGASPALPAQKPGTSEAAGLGSETQGGGEAANESDSKTDSPGCQS